MAVATKPYVVLDNAYWHGDRDGLVAIIGAAAAITFPPHFVARGEEYVAADWGGIRSGGLLFSKQESCGPQVAIG